MSEYFCSKKLKKNRNKHESQVKFGNIQAAHGWQTSLHKFGNSANQFWIAYAENYCQNWAKRATLSASKGKYNKHWSQSNKLHIKSMAIKWPLARHRQMFAQKRKGGRQRERLRWRWTHTSCRICVARTLAVAVKKSQPLGTRWGCLQRLTVTLASPHHLLLLLLVPKLQMARHQCEWVQANVAALPKWAATFWGHTSLEANLKPEKSQVLEGRVCQCCKPLTKTLLIPLQLVHVCST